MKRPVIVLAMILAGGVVFSSAAFGLDPPAGQPQMPGAFMAPPPHGSRMEPPVNRGLKLICDNMQINVLAELTGLSQENIRQLLISSPPQAIIDAYGVSPEVFCSSMDKQTTKLISQAALAGVITRKQAEEIQKKLSMKPTGPYQR